MQLLRCKIINYISMVSLIILNAMMFLILIKSNLMGVGNVASRYTIAKICGSGCARWGTAQRKANYDRNTYYGNFYFCRSGQRQEEFS